MPSSLAHFAGMPSIFCKDSANEMQIGQAD